MVLLVLPILTHVSATCWIQLIEAARICFMFLIFPLDLSRGVGGEIVGQAQSRKRFQAPACIRPINILLAKANHMAEVRV